MKRARWIGISILLILLGWSSATMIVRMGNQELWGHWPMIQFLSGWLLIAAFSYGKKNPLLDKHLAWSTASGLLLTLGFPPFPLPILLFVGFIPLLHILHAEKKSRSWFFYCLHAFMIWNIGATFWVANTAYAAGIFANGVNSLLMTLPMLAYAYTYRKLGRGVAIISFIACWISFEFLHMRWELYWPWLTLGNGLSSMHWGVQWYAFTGVFGGTAWILGVNYLLYDWWFCRIENGRKQLIVLSGVVLVPLIISLIDYGTQTDQGESREVVAIQPNYEPHYEKFQIPSAAVADHFVQLSQELITPQTDYVVFPETSFSRVDLDQIQSHALADGVQRLLGQNPEIRLVTGLAGYRFLTDSTEKSLPTTRIIPGRSGDTLFVEAYNCAIQVESTGETQEYYKSLFVPGAEIFPFKHLLFFFQPLVDRLGGTFEGYRTREKFNLFTADDARIIPAICYESIFGEYLAHFVRRGANAIFIITNDGWWDNTAGHRQHASFARLRAIELRKSIARSANMGTCCFINQRGDMSQATEYGVEGGIRGEIYLNDEITFYAQWGDFLGRISLFFSFLLLFRAFVHRYRIT